MNKENNHHSSLGHDLRQQKLIISQRGCYNFVSEKDLLTAYVLCSLNETSQIDVRHLPPSMLLCDYDCYEGLNKDLAFAEEKVLSQNNFKWAVMGYPVLLDGWKMKHNFADEYKHHLTKQLFSGRHSECDWLKVIKILIIAKALAQHYYKKQKYKMMLGIIEWTSELFVERGINDWIRVEGGWGQLSKYSKECLKEQTVSATSPARTSVALRKTPSARAKNNGQKTNGATSIYQSFDDISDEELPPISTAGDLARAYAEQLKTKRKLKKQTLRKYHTLVDFTPFRRLRNETCADVKEPSALQRAIPDYPEFETALQERSVHKPRRNRKAETENHKADNPEMWELPTHPNGSTPATSSPVGEFPSFERFQAKDVKQRLQF